MIPTDRPSIRRKDMDSVLTCMVNDNLGPGDRSNELVAAVSAHLGIGGGIAVRERGRALALALNMLELPQGTGVAMDPLVPAYYHEVVLARGFIPVYVDVSRDGPCIDAGVLTKLFSEGDGLVAASYAAIVTHTTLGYVPDMEAIAALGLPVIEDISEGIGANTGDRMVGSYGRLVIVGMEPDSIITAGGGTLLLAATKADAGRLKNLAAEIPPEALLPDMNAALGLTQIHELERFIARRAELAAIFSRAVMRGRHSAPGQPGDAQNVHKTFPVTFTGGTGEAREYARKKGVETAMAFDESALSRLGKPISQIEAGELLRAPVIDERLYPAALALALRCVRFPLYPALTSKEVSTIERVLSTLP